MDRQPGLVEDYHKTLMELVTAQNVEIQSLRGRRSSNGSGSVAKIVASVAVTALAAFGGLWLTYGQNAVTKTEVKEELREAIAPITKTAEEQDTKLEALRLAVWKLDTDFKVVRVRLGIPEKEEK